MSQFRFQRDAAIMDPLVKITILDLPNGPKTGDGLCQDCYESLSHIEPSRKVPRISRLRTSSKSCPCCRTLLEFIVATQHQATKPFSIPNSVDIGRSWACWVNDYSRAKQNRNEYQSTALLRLIDFVQDLKKDESLLGLWKEDIAEGLLWERGVWSEPAGRKRITPFPSWTWMSLPGAVQYPSFSLASKEIELIHPRICWSSQPLNSTLRIAELLLRAKVFKGTLTYHGRESSKSSLYLDLDGSSRVALFERVDIPDSYHDNNTVRLILIGGTKHHWFFLITSVVNPERNPHVRIGRAYSPCNHTFKKLKDHFATVDPQIITLR